MISKTILIQRGDTAQLHMERVDVVVALSYLVCRATRRRGRVCACWCFKCSDTTDFWMAGSELARRILEGTFLLAFALVDSY